ncbi:apolipoprotein A-II [Mauremys reevesii]|uniref:apolipoprotein A-II n=1 Tax=Mauremys reevesii TaxID=260615 RepID=UPI00193F2A9A|nr:apolipoprotein A-II [Mauremys reevesii]XP_039369399.1 apolipoprotein A-II [Mauremys reevesii]
MKVLVLAVVLLCVCSLEGAVVKRNAETPSLSDVFSQYFQTVSEYLSKQLPEKAKTEELKTQAKAYLEQAHEQLSPIAKQLHTEFMDLITQLVETGKKAVKQ